MMSSRRMSLCAWVLLLLWEGAQSAVPPPPSAQQQEHCESGITLVLQEIKSIMASTGVCSANKKQELAMEALTSALQQQGQLVTSLVAQTETLQVAVKAVAELQETQRQTMSQIRRQMEDDRQIRRNQRRTLEDLTSDVLKVGKEGQARAEDLRLLEGTVKSGLKKAELETNEAATEMKEAQSRTQELAKVIRRVQKSLSSIETRINLQANNMLVLKRDNIGRRRSQSFNNRNKLSSTNETTTIKPPIVIPALESPLECPHPFTKLGTNCYTVHTQERLSWQQARDRCSADLSGDLANPDDMYELQLFLDESFPGGWGFWIGAQSEISAAENSWAWVSGLPVEIGLDFWGRGEPGELDVGDSCLYVHSWWRFRAGSDPCDEQKYFICEFKMETI